MLLENIGPTVSMIGCIAGFVLIIFGGFFYLLENKSRIRIAKAVRILGIGILTTTVSIPFSIPGQLVAMSTSVDVSLLGVIILSVFLGSPLIFMGLASYIGLNTKANRILNPATAQEKLRYHSPIEKKKQISWNKIIKRNA